MHFAAPRRVNSIAHASLSLLLIFSNSTPLQAQTSKDADNTQLTASGRLVRSLEPTTPPEEYGLGVRSTEPRNPLDELRGFRVPDQLTVELVASEPAIAKPLNMAFDWRGRLWVTQTYEYPYPYDAARDPEQRGPKDSIVILEDVDGDGYRETATTFADGLNIPIGILPFENGVLCFSIPNIYMLRDTDGDNVCDSREVVLGPFDTTRDTHGMVNSLRSSPDGWVMANHGFNNNSKVSGTDGRLVTMSSGNVFRFKPDGSSVELYAQGQVNPFGMTIDQWGEVFTADCHSKPISQVIQGGCYPSFGRPHDGLGFIAPVMDHLHGSTAIAGLELGQGSNLPAEFQSRFFSGNVMTSRINSNQIDRSGLSVRAIEQPDLLTSDDSWFRPVDVRLGPDGWLYVADFYNRVIGHYEVPLDHPGRDRFRGRIWRIGVKSEVSSPSTELASSLNTIANCVATLDDNNPTLRRLAMQRIEEIVNANPATISQLLQGPLTSKLETPQAKSAVARLQSELTPIDDWFEPNLNACEDPDAIVAASAWQIFADWTASFPHDDSAIATAKPNLSETLASRAIEAVRNWKSSPHAAAAAARVLAKIGRANDVPPMLQAIADCKSVDPMMFATLRIVVREMLNRPLVRSELFVHWTSSNLCQPDSAKTSSPSTSKTESTLEQSGRSSPDIEMDSKLGHELFQIMIALPATQFPAEAGLAYVSKNFTQLGLRDEVLRSIVTALPDDQIDGLLCLMDDRLLDMPDMHLLHLRTVINVLQQQARLKPAVQQRAAAVLAKYFQRVLLDDSDSSVSQLISWSSSGPQRSNILDGTSARVASWPLDTRPTQESNGSVSHLMFSSFPLGESYTGSLRSGPLTGISKLHFYLSGHNGLPTEPDSHLNRVELVDGISREVLQITFPPRNDAAIKIEWDLQPYQSRPVFLRVVDGDAGGTYAWLAVGGFSTKRLDVAREREDFANALELLGQVGGFDQSPDIVMPELPRSFDPRYRLEWQLRSKRQVNLADALAIQAWDAGHLDLAISALDDLAVNRSSDELSLLQALAMRSDAIAQQQLASFLASQSRWHEALLAGLNNGWLAASSIEKLTSDWWEANRANSIIQSIAEFRPSQDEKDKQRAERFIQRRTEVVALNGDTERGKALFGQHCGQCHQFAGQGKVVGPQLEGVGGRGFERLCEDILMPNQNVDHAFWTTAILTQDGQVLSGLVRQRDDVKLVMADVKGEERSIELSSIEEEKQTRRSLMPENFDEILSAQQLCDLIRYLQIPIKQK